MKLTKTYLYDYIAGGFYRFRVFKIEDAHHYVYFMGTPVSHGGTKIADSEAELKALLDAQVPVINDFLSKIDKGWSK